MFNLKQAATKVGISEGLLILWISTGKFKPSIETSITDASFPAGSLAQRAIAAHAGPGNEVLGWARFLLTDDDMERLGGLVEQTAERKAKEPAHIKGVHYTAKELATEWGVSADTIRKMFEDEPGVLRQGKSTSRRGKRRYLSIRIPEEVAQRVHQRLSQV
jgi:hypothetical protein